jgi:hypothetical protein
MLIECSQCTCVSVLILLEWNVQLFNSLSKNKDGRGEFCVAYLLIASLGFTPIPPRIDILNAGFVSLAVEWGVQVIWQGAWWGGYVWCVFELTVSDSFSHFWPNLSRFFEISQSDRQQINCLVSSSPLSSSYPKLHFRSSSMIGLSLEVSKHKIGGVQWVPSLWCFNLM